MDRQTLLDHHQQVHGRQARRAFVGARRPQLGASGASLAALPSHLVHSRPPGLGCPPAPDVHRGDPRYCAPSRRVALPPHPPCALCPRRLRSAAEARTPPPLSQGPAPRLPTRASPSAGQARGPGIGAGRPSGAGYGARPDGRARGAGRPGTRTHR